MILFPAPISILPLGDSLDHDALLEHQLLSIRIPRDRVFLWAQAPMQNTGWKLMEIVVANSFRPNNIVFRIES